VWYFEQALGALPHLPETCNTHAQAIDSNSPCARRSFRLATLAYPRGSARGRVPRGGLDDPRRLEQVSLFMSVHFFVRSAYDQAIAAGQRALTLATASGRVSTLSASASTALSRSAIIASSLSSSRIARAPGLSFLLMTASFANSSPQKMLESETSGLCPRCPRPRPPAANRGQGRHIPQLGIVTTCAVIPVRRQFPARPQGRGGAPLA
jgi:hypothetical protein